MLRKVLTTKMNCDKLKLRNAAKELIKVKNKVRKYRELTELKGRIREKKKSYRFISEETGISLSTINNKINGYASFDILEAAKIAPLLDIPPEEISAFFA